MTEFSESQKAYMNELFNKFTEKLNNKAEEINLNLKKEIIEVKQDIHQFANVYQDKIKALEIQNQQLKENINYLQKKVRKNNLIIFGIESTAENLWTSIINLFRTTLEIDILDNDFNDIYKIGNDNKSPVVIEFISYQKKLLALKNAHKLKGRNINIVQDLSPEDRTNQKVLIKHMQEARKKGLKSYIKGQKLVIGEDIYTLKQLENKEANFSSETLYQNREDSESEDIEECHSAPPTPDPQRRQKRVLNELGLTEEPEQQAKKKPKSATSKKAFKYVNPSVIKTRSNTAPILD